MAALRCLGCGLASQLPPLAALLCVAYLDGAGMLKEACGALFPEQRLRSVPPPSQAAGSSGPTHGVDPARPWKARWPARPPPREPPPARAPPPPPSAAPPPPAKAWNWPRDLEYPFKEKMPLEMALAGVDGELRYAPWEAEPKVRCDAKQLLHARERQSGTKEGEWVPRPNRTPVFTVGLHKTGTMSYARIYQLMGLVSLHGVWWPTGDKTKHDAFADGGGVRFFWNDKFQFGDAESHPIWSYVRCWPGATLVLSVRGLYSWLRSKLKHEYMNHDGSEEDVLRFGSIMAHWTLFRDKYHRRILDIAMANATIARQLIILDLPDEGPVNTSCALCQRLEIDCCKKNIKAHGSYPGLRLKNATAWNHDVERSMERALSLLRVPPDQAEDVKRRPLLSLDLVRSPEVLAWLRAEGYGRLV